MTFSVIFNLQVLLTHWLVHWRNYNKTTASTHIEEKTNLSWTATTCMYSHLHACTVTYLSWTATVYACTATYVHACMVTYVLVMDWSAETSRPLYACTVTYFWSAITTVYVCKVTYLSQSQLSLLQWSAVSASTATSPHSDASVLRP